MSKLNNVWAVADANASTAELERVASVIGSNVTVVTCPEGVCFINCIPAIANAVVDAKPDAVITAATKNGRLLAGRLAVMFDTVVLSDLSAVTVNEDGVRTGRMVYGGAAIRTEVVSGTAVLCIGSGLLEDECAEAQVTKLEISDCADEVVFVEKRSKEVKSVNLNAAKRVVAAGRGVATEETLAVLQDIATAIEAEIGCTRPVSEESGWLPVERYIGVSGAKVKPDFYLAAGISGQMQHMVGCSDAGVIFAVNKDKNSPIFKQCDYGIVGDTAVVLPAILDALK